MSMTPEAKSKLSTTIRALRTRLLTDLKSSAESTYQFASKIDRAKLTAAQRVRRGRIDEWVDLEVRTQAGRKNARKHEDFRRDLEKQAAYTLLNRMVILRLMESMGLRRQKVATGGWNSSIYKAFREIARTLVEVKYDENEGLAFLLQLIFEELALDMPGLYGPAGAAELIPIPPATLRAVIEAFDDPELESCWTDDMTLGWIYQYWNDPERKQLDTKVKEGGKIETHEIASKTQMFTERYMVDWLLQNSLGPMWLATCKKHDWTPACESSGALDALEQRRVEWRSKRDAGEVELIDLMPLHTEMEQRWAYYLPQPIPDDAVEHAAESVRDLKILDPAVGSGHFLVVAFDLLFALYLEEAKHRGEADDKAKWSPKAIVERILEHNLYGIDLDPRAVQIAAAALWLKAQQACPDAHPQNLNLVASNLGITSLADNDPALVELRSIVQAETGVPAKLTNDIIEALRGADHLGSLLKIDKAVDDAINTFEAEVKQRPVTWQPDFFGTPQAIQQKIDFDAEATRKSLVDGLESFLSKHNAGEDIGLRLRGEQLAIGVRFLRMIKEGSYDLVVANPPYQGVGKLAASVYVTQHYSLGKSDLFAAFLLRGLELVRDYGVSAMLTIRNWMFISDYASFREFIFTEHALMSIGDVSWGAFREMRDNPVTMSVVRRGNQSTHVDGVAISPTDPQLRVRTQEEYLKKEAGTLIHNGLKVFQASDFAAVPDWPLVYWWSESTLDLYRQHPLIAQECITRRGATTGSNARFLRSPFELPKNKLTAVRYETTHEEPQLNGAWVPYIKGAAGRQWMDSLTDAVRWMSNGLELSTSIEHNFGDGSIAWKLCNAPWDATRGVVYSTIGSSFSARIHRFHSVVDVSGATLVPRGKTDIADLLCRLNSSSIRSLVGDLNPSVNYQLADLKRAPLFPVSEARVILDLINEHFSRHESHRESSVEFKQPGSSSWRQVQEWAQMAVDRGEDESLPDYLEQLDPEPPTDHLSFALGVALGRFGADGEGILDPTSDSLDHALPAGILFLDGTLDADEEGDSLSHPASTMLRTSWARYGSQIKTNRSLRQWLSLDFFKDVHKGMYENRPIHWPLSSAKKTFVAWVNIHRMNDRTLTVLLADHLQPTLTRLDGELNDLTEARSSSDRKVAREADDRYADVKAWRDELAVFIANVNQCALRGPAPPDSQKPERGTDAAYNPVLDDGVMINSSALWPLLDQQWKEPKKWWKELVAAKGKKDYDWSHLAVRYWPNRVDKKCQSDPSLGVAHGCFWKYHPARAWAWELRLQDEIEQEFRIREESYRGDGGDNEHRDTFLADHPDTAFEAIDKELTRRIRKSEEPVSEMRILEPGIWSALPERCFALELRTSGTQELNFRLQAPDSDESRNDFLHTRSDEAWSIVRSEILHRRSPRDPLTNFVMIDEGLWITIPGHCWALELEISRLQNEAFTLDDPHSETARPAFISSQSAEAMKIVTEDINARPLTKQKPLTEYTITNAGLWANCAAECYDLEIEVIKKQKTPFQLIDPDHESSRSKFEQANPDKAAERKKLIEKFCPPELPGMDSDPEPKKRKRKANKTGGAAK
ncbi:MAG: BREX-6 system adenine-specific DNA-methyltransferase PglX [Pirellulaceae bacterium]